MFRNNAFSNCNRTYANLLATDYINDIANSSSMQRSSPDSDSRLVPSNQQSQQGIASDDDKSYQTLPRGFPSGMHRSAIVSSSVSKGGSTTKSQGQGTKEYFPVDFVPTIHHVICGRGKKSYGHSGNKRFLELVAERRHAYETAKTKQDKSDIVQGIVNEIEAHGGFIRLDTDTQRYYVAEDGSGREKTSQYLRDFLKDKYKSSKEIKRRNRKEKRLLAKEAIKEDKETPFVPKKARSSAPPKEQQQPKTPIKKQPKQKKRAPPPVIQNKPEQPSQPSQKSTQRQHPSSQIPNQAFSLAPVIAAPIADRGAMITSSSPVAAAQSANKMSSHAFLPPFEPIQDLIGMTAAPMPLPTNDDNDDEHEMEDDLLNEDSLANLFPCLPGVDHESPLRCVRRSSFFCLPSGTVSADIFDHNDDEERHVEEDVVEEDYDHIGKTNSNEISFNCLFSSILAAPPAATTHSRPEKGDAIMTRTNADESFLFQTIFPHPNTHTNSDSNNQHDSDMESLPISQSEIDALEDVDPADLMIF